MYRRRDNRVGKMTVDTQYQTGNEIKGAWAKEHAGNELLEKERKIVHSTRIIHNKTKEVFRKKREGLKLNPSETMIYKTRTASLELVTKGIKGKMLKKSVQDAIARCDDPTIYNFSCT